VLNQKNKNKLGGINKIKLKKRLNKIKILKNKIGGFKQNTN